MSRSKKAVSIIPLTNFESEVDLVKLDSTLNIRRIDPDERKRLTKLAPGYDFTLEHVLNDVEYVIEKRWKEEKPKVWAEHSRFTTDIVLALRLLKNSSITTPTSFLLHPDGRSYAISEPSPRVNLEMDRYFLEEREIDTFIELWKKLQTVEKEKPHLKFPLFQFTKAFEEPNSEYIIVNFMTAFESLVFHRGKEIPKPYGRTIGITIGMLLGKNEKERAEIEKTLKDAYDIRNAIVHGHLRKKLQKYDDTHRTKIIFEAEDYLRRSLRKLLEE